MMRFDRRVARFTADFHRRTKLSVVAGLQAEVRELFDDALLLARLLFCKVMTQVNHFAADNICIFSRMSLLKCLKISK